MKSDAPTLQPKPSIRIPMSALRLNRRFTEWVLDEMIHDANKKAGPGAHLDKLLRSWVKADCSLEKWYRANPGFFLGLREACLEWRVLPFEGLAPMEGQFRPMLGAPYGLDTAGETRVDAEKWVACETFAVFIIISGAADRIGVCKHCDDLFWNKWGHKNKRFCERKCSQIQTAAEGHARKVRDERRKKNTRIKKALEDIALKPPEEGRKEWVAQRAGVTKTYLTQAINRGRQGKPDGLRLPKRQSKWLAGVDRKRQTGEHRRNIGRATSSQE